MSDICCKESQGAHPHVQQKEGDPERIVQESDEKSKMKVE
jgi:hypothetical protein